VSAKIYYEEKQAFARTKDWFADIIPIRIPDDDEEAMAGQLRFWYRCFNGTARRRLRKIRTQRM
jgi:hypothetical protein